MKNLFILSIIILFKLSAYAQYPIEVKKALQQTINNRQELKKALTYFYKTGDPLKIKSINFLIAHMPIHNSLSYYWVDDLGKKVQFNELNYSTFNQAIEAFHKLKKVHKVLRPVPYSYRDIDSISSNYLIENIELAISQYRKNELERKISEDDFLEYILPYRVSVEPISKWRKAYLDKFSSIFDKSSSSDSLKIIIKYSINNFFENLWGIDKTEPLPRLGATQILLRGKGYCEDLADMITFVARSNGIPSAIDNIPVWATASGSHFLNFLKLDNSKPHFDAVLDSLGREPGKVLRTTYSEQKETVASWIDTAQIPPGFMRLKNYKDVTQEYWSTESFTCKLFNNTKAKVVFLAVLNSGSWQPLWFAKKNGDFATYTNMGKGAVFLPMYYEKNKLMPAGYPYALGYKDQVVLQPDSSNTHMIVLNNQEKYLKYKPGKKYRLLIWNNQWKQLGEKIAPPECTQLTFERVPKNALLLLVPEYSQGKERPFTIEENGVRLWW